MKAIFEAKRHNQRMKQYDDELDSVCFLLNQAYELFIGYKVRYSQIIDYFRVQPYRGNINQEQYYDRASKFIGYKRQRKASR